MAVEGVTVHHLGVACHHRGCHALSGRSVQAVTRRQMLRELAVFFIVSYSKILEGFLFYYLR